MNEAGPEQSMEDILASIKRVISADAAAARRLPPSRPLAPDPGPDLDDDVLELGEPPAVAAPPPPAPPPHSPPPPPPLMSTAAEQQSRAALGTLRGLAAEQQAGASALDGLVRELLRPMLKQWLDRHLPELVEQIVAREVARITGR